MPIYEYQCTRCGERLERLQRMSDPALTECPECGGDLEKLLSAPAFQFKGSGWYVTDYAGKGKSPSDSGDSSSADGGSAAGDKTSKEAGPKPSGESSSSKTKASSSSD